ncbi:MAG TPA: uracil-DNA glycosylase, partial [Gemmatimonadaceae bacterium]|nr:uracil-DNA glycosylase [Gemmatimonadaceae bacterium]
MNARERLRAYIEQRREMGESEMMLDALDVDDVMRMLGALQGGSAPDGAASSAPGSASRSAPSITPEPASRTSDDTRAPTAAPREVERSERVVFKSPDAAASSPASDDWREMMRTLQGTVPPRPPAPEPSTSAGIGDAPPTPAPVTSASASAGGAGVLRIEGIVVPAGLRVERPTLTGLAAGSEWQSLAEIATVVSTCTACPLYQTATLPVPGVGDPNADVMVIGEAPGEREDQTGEPFVGPAGALLNKILASIQLTRETVFIANVLKHRPPGNRNPMPDEVRACSPYLQRQIDLVQPKLILAFGTFAAQSLLGTKLALGKLRQQIHWYQGIPLVATYHPAALLRNDA